MEKRKKILYIITKGNFGGAQRYVYDLAVNLSKENFEAVVACGEGDLLKQKLEEKGVRVIKLQSSQRNINIFKDFKTFFEIKKIIKEEKPDVIHLNSSKIGGLGALAGRLHGVKKIIFTAHGWAFNEDRDFVSRSIIIFLHWLTVLFTHQSVVVSHKVRRDIESLPFVNKKVLVIHNGIEKFETVDRESAQKSMRIESGDKTVIVSLSELNKNKGLDTALRGLSLLKKEKLEKILYCILGRGEEEAHLTSLIKELNLENNVKLLGFMDNAKALLSGADIFLLPSRTEAFPYVILEAGLARLPIITTSVGGIPEVIKDMQNGILIHPNKPREIAEAITYLLDHKEKQKEFGEKIMKTVEESFMIKNMIKETTSLY